MQRVNTGGIVLILIGVLFLLFNFNILSWHVIWKFWPLILVGIGASMLIPRKPQ